MTANKIELDGGKYTVVNELNNGGKLHALRYGEEWRDLTGDGLILAMIHEIEQMREDNKEYKTALMQIAHGDTWTAHPHDIAAWALGLERTEMVGDNE